MKSYILDVLAFILTLVLTFIFGWTAKDLVWGLWASTILWGILFCFKPFLFFLFDFHRKRGDFINLFTSLLAALIFSIVFLLLSSFSFFLVSAFNYILDNSTSSHFNVFDRLSNLIGLWPLVLVNLIHWSKDSISKSGNNGPLDDIARGVSDVKMVLTNTLWASVLIFALFLICGFNLGRGYIYVAMAVYFFPWRSVFRFVKL